MQRFKTFFGSMGRRKTRIKHAQLLYGMVVASARRPELFSRFEIADSFDGRFEMLITHLYVLNAGLAQHGDAGRALSQGAFDLFIADMDAVLRELAVGDQVVPKRLAKMTRVVHGRAAAYDLARSSSDDPKQAVAQVVSRNVFDGREPQNAEHFMAEWICGRINRFPSESLANVIDDRRLFVIEEELRE